MLEATFIGLWVFGWDRLSPKCTSPRSTWSGSGPGCPPTSSSRRTPGCSTRSATRSTSRRAHGGDRHRRDPLPGVRALRVGSRRPRRAGDGDLLRARGLLLAPAPRPQRGRLPRRCEARDRGRAACHVRPTRRRERVRRRRHRRAADEDRGDGGSLGHRAAGRVPLFQIGGFTEDDQTPSFDIEVPGLLSFLATNSFDGEVVGINELQSKYEQEFGPGNYVPDVRLCTGACASWRTSEPAAPPRALGRLAAAAHEASRRDVVPEIGDPRDRVPVPVQLRRLDPDRGRTPAVGRATGS